MSLSAQNTGGHPSGPVHQGRLPADAATSPDQVCLVTRFSAVDDAALRKLVDELRATAASVVTEPGHVTYGVFTDQANARALYVIETWASAADARRHEELVVDNGAVARVAPLLAEELRTHTLRPVDLDGHAGQAARDEGPTEINTTHAMDDAQGVESRKRTSV